MRNKPRQNLQPPIFTLVQGISNTRLGTEGSVFSCSLFPNNPPKSPSCVPVLVMVLGEEVSVFDIPKDNLSFDTSRLLLVENALDVCAWKDTAKRRDM